MIIKYNEFLNESNEIYTIEDPEFWGIEKYEWVNGYLDCYQNVILNREFEILPFKFGKIFGNFLTFHNKNLKTLIYCPEYVEGDFDCYQENDIIKNYNYCPKKVGGSFYGESIIHNIGIEGYPLCIIQGRFFTNDGDDDSYDRLTDIIRENEDKFIPLLDDKIKFHQMIMRLDPSLIKYYKTIPPPSKKSLL